VSGASTSISFNVLQIVVISLIIGIAALKSGKKADPFLAFNRSALAIIQTVLWWIIRLAPLGTLGLIGNAVATYGWDLLAPLATFAAAIYIGLALVLFVVYPVILRTNGLKITSYFKGAWPAIQLAFVSRSSIGTLGLIGHAVAEYGWDLLSPLATFAVDVYVGCALVMFGVYPLLLVLAGRLNPLRFFAGAWPAIELAFVSRSSVGTMPLTQRVVTERLGVPADYASFAVPFGATTKMDGCAAIYPALAAIFVARVFGVSLGVEDYLLIAFVSVVG
jgi:Na+/H+-dicarboxylate symporter